MALTTDPLFVMPEYGWERSTWFAVHIVTSDAATSGLQPAYITVDLNLPPQASDEDIASLWLGVHTACRDIGLAVVTGHTGRYDGCAFPTIGSATVVSIGPRDDYITPAMARVGDAILMTKGPAIETTALLGVAFPQHISSVLGPDIARAASDLFCRMSVVVDARLAAGVGLRDLGVTTMHDATEGGVWNGLWEIAEASGVGMLVDLRSVHIRPEVAALCDLFDIDPFSASSEGTLLLTARRGVVGALRDRMADAGIDLFHVGEIVPPEEGVCLIRDGSVSPLPRPGVDPFWPAYRQAREAGHR
jgi:hydrogenase maturation factor